MSRLSDAPVFYTLTQLRIDPVLELADVIPAIQADLRQRGLTDFDQSQDRNYAITPSETGLSISQKDHERYIFRNAAKTEAIVLDANTITYETTAYPVFERFRERLLQALEIIRAHRGIEFCDRIGMRMLDAIQAKDGDDLRSYAVPQAFALVDKLDGMAHQQSVTESRYARENMRLILRAFLSNDGVALPPDLMPLQLKVDDKFAQQSGPALMLDSDAFCTQRQPCDDAVVRDTLGQLKAALSSGFKRVVTDHALEMWK